MSRSGCPTSRGRAGTARSPEMFRSGRFRLIVGNSPTGSGPRGAVAAGVTNALRLPPIGPIGVSATWLITAAFCRSGATWLMRGTERLRLDCALVEAEGACVFARAPVSREGYTGVARVSESPAWNTLRSFVASFTTRGCVFNVSGGLTDPSQYPPFFPFFFPCRSEP